MDIYKEFQNTNESVFFYDFQSQKSHASRLIEITHSPPKRQFSWWVIVSWAEE